MKQTNTKTESKAPEEIRENLFHILDEYAEKFKQDRLSRDEHVKAKYEARKRETANIKAKRNTEMAEKERKIEPLKKALEDEKIRSRGFLHHSFNDRGLQAVGQVGV